MYKLMAAALSNTFVNRRGEISNNLETSRSNVAKNIRENRERIREDKCKIPIFKQIRDYNRKALLAERERDSLRKQGLKLSDVCARAQKFEEANKAHRSMLAYKAKVRELNKST